MDPSLVVGFLLLSALLWERSLRPKRNYSSTGLKAMRQGFLVGVANPKSIVSLMAILPQFVDHDLGNPTLQMLIIGVIGGIAQAAIETVWVVGAGRLCARGFSDAHADCSTSRAQAAWR